MKKYLSLALAAVLLTASVTACETREVADQIENIYGRDDQHVQSVRNGTASAYPGKTWGGAFDDFFSAPTWKYFEGTLNGPDENNDGKPDYTEDGIDIVEFTGHCMYSDTNVLARIQFRLNNDGTFEPIYLSFNEVPQNRLMLSQLIEEAFNSYTPPVVTKPVFGKTEDKLNQNADQSDAAASETVLQTLAVTMEATKPAVTEAPANTDPRIGNPFDRKIVVSDSSAGIYLRSAPDLDADHLTLIPKNEIVTAYNCSTPGWFYTTYNGISGYIYAEYTKDPNTQAGSSHSYIGYGRVNVSASSAGIYLRPYAQLDAEWLTLIPKNEIIDLYSCDSSDWYYTYYDGKEGYVYADYIAFGDSGSSYNNSSSNNSFIGYGTVTVSAASAGIYLRPYCDLDAEWLALIPKDISIPLYSSGNSEWYYTCYDGQWGYVYADYVR